MAKRLVAGIDEAGRGPLIGCMFQACVVVDEHMLGVLRRSGVRDSKSIPRVKRALILRTILNVAEAVLIRSYPPPLIDKENINVLLADGAVKLANAAASLCGGRLARVYVDEISGSKARSVLSGAGVPIIMEAGADRKYVVVSAASIVAKYFRDAHIDRLRLIWGDIGSGYPSDPRTREWIVKRLKELRDLPPIVRASWRTLAKLSLRKGRGLERWIRRSDP